MLDIQFIRTNPDAVRQAATDKQLYPDIVDQLLAIDEKRRELQIQVDEIRRQSNEHVDLIKKAVFDGGKPSPEQIKKGKQIKAQLQAIEPDLKLAEEEYLNLMLQIPNVPADSVPVGADESGNQLVRQEGKLPKFEHDPLDHQQLMENLEMLDIKQGVKIAGFRGYYLKNDGFILHRAILQYAIDLLIQEEFSPMMVPNIVNKEAMVGTGYLPWGEEDHYKTQDDGYLTGSSEVALTAYYADQLLAEKDLPIKMTSVSTCYRREVGSYGKDTKGIVRVHQFDKVEQVVYTVADEAETTSWHETMLGFSERLLTDLKLPYQVLLMCTGDMGAGQRKKYDIETWFPAQNKYRETHSASYFNDFQARRLNIRYQAKDGTIKYVYTLNNTMAASPRLLAAVIENYQQPDGSIKVPDVLQNYVGKEIIS